MSRTHTLATMVVSKAAYDEIRQKLGQAGYAHALVEEGGDVLLDMTGIALVADPLEGLRKESSNEQG